MSTDELGRPIRAFTDPAFVAACGQSRRPSGAASSWTVTVVLVEASVMEHAVHLLDLIDAVGGAPAPEAAVQRALDMVAWWYPHRSTCWRP